MVSFGISPDRKIEEDEDSEERNGQRKSRIASDQQIDTEQKGDEYGAQSRELSFHEGMIMRLL